ncbi:restriction endonuclease subunit S [Oceanicaulis alexandrii]|uniref:restriction endonuclease subunit S n=1 Tax=Oceanicaulis alexandrii TaxID=153233 RepID=UPI002354821F|nr:restriction endonuclease subunit S [Oceanicaulis alexandrii]
MFANLPSGWEQLPQQAVAKFYNGRAYKLKEWEDTGTPVIRLQNLTGSGNKFYYSKLKLPEHQYCVKGDLLYMWSATFGPHIWDGDRAIYHYHIWKVEQAHNKLDRTFHFFILSHLTEQWKSGANGMAMLHLTKKGMEQLTIPVPPLPEQNRIAEILTAVDDSIHAGERVIEQAERVKKGLMEELLTGGLGSAAIERGEAPEGWALDRLSNSIDLISGQHVDSEFVNDAGIGTPYLTGPADFIGLRPYATKYTESPKVMCRAGDILLTVKGSGAGKSVRSDGEYCISRQLMAVRPKRCESKWLEYVLYGLKARLADTASGIIPGISRPDILNYLVAIPPAYEQKRIASILTSVDDQIATERKHVEQQKRLKQGLMDDLLTGRVRTV